MPIKFVLIVVSFALLIIGQFRMLTKMSDFSSLIGRLGDNQEEEEITDNVQSPGSS